MRIVFMGTPEFAVPSLRRLCEAGHTVCGVFTQPDKPRSRRKVSFSPVKEYAITQSIPVYQPAKMRDGEALALLQQLQPELLVVAAFGRILPNEILTLPKYGAINVHSSILPAYRGAAPIQWAILDGLDETGVTIMDMVQELDAGDILSVVKTAIGPQETAPELTARLAELGAEALVQVVEQIAAGTVQRTPQGDAFTYAPMLRREMSPVDWTRSSRQILDQIRALLPWPCASAELGGNRLKLYSAQAGTETSAAAGTILQANKHGIEVACGDGRSILLTEVQAEGGRRMSAAAYLAGHPIRV